MIKTVKTFGKVNGQETYLYTILNDVLSAEICDFGATLIRLYYDGVNVVCGYDNVDRYILNDSYMGAIVLPNANRIRDARFTLNGKEYHYFLRIKVIIEIALKSRCEARLIQGHMGWTAVHLEREFC